MKSFNNNTVSHRSLITLFSKIFAVSAVQQGNPKLSVYLDPKINIRDPVKRHLIA